MSYLLYWEIKNELFGSTISGFIEKNLFCLWKYYILVLLQINRGNKSNHVFNFACYNHYKNIIPIFLSWIDLTTIISVLLFSFIFYHNVLFVLAHMI